MINNKEKYLDIFDQFGGKGWGEDPSGIPQFRKLVLDEPVNGDLGEVLKKEHTLRRLINAFRREGKHVGVLDNGNNEVSIVAHRHPESLGNNTWHFNPFRPRKAK